MIIWQVFYDNVLNLGYEIWLTNFRRNMNIEKFTLSDNQIVQKEIISKIRDLINFKNLEPGDKLPSERMLSEKFEVTRSNVREAIQKLEFYGLLKSIPQSGTFVANIGVIALNGMIEDILTLDEPDFKSLVETRILLELKTARLAALRRKDEDLIAMKDALDAYSEKVLNDEDAVQEDLLFHLAVFGSELAPVESAKPIPTVIQQRSVSKIPNQERSDSNKRLHSNFNPKRIGKLGCTPHLIILTGKIRSAYGHFLEDNCAFNGEFMAFQNCFLLYSK